MKSTVLSVDMLANLALFVTCFGSPSLAAPLEETLAMERRASPVLMGAAKTFGGLAGTTLTNSGDTAITGLGGVGDGGAYPGTSMTGFPPGTASGVLGAGTTFAQKGQAACLEAYNNARSIPPTAALPSATLGGNTLPAGVYTFPTSAVTLAGTLTLDAANNSKAQFIFQIDTTFTAGARSKIVLINKAKACNVYFVIGTSASIGAGAQLQGNFIAKTLIAAGEAASNQGTWCSLGAAVTLINNALVAQAGACPT